MFSIIDAYTQWTLEQRESEEKDEEKNNARQRKAAGARIAGVSTGSGSAQYVPKGIAVGDPRKLRSRAASWDD